MSLVLNVEILGEYQNLSKATKGANDSFADLGKKFAKVGANIAKVTAAIGVGIGVLAVSEIKKAIDAASDLSESTNAVNVSFGDAAAGILELGENAARGLGLSKTELFGIATQFSNFAGTIAGEGGNIVQVVDEISQRGADFASVFNLDVADALAKFQSGLAGQSEPLRMYGIDLSAAAVEAHALEKGITDGTSQMTEAEKVTARYSLLMQETSKVTGDFANTSDGLANQQRILKAEIENTRAEIGEKFMPIMQAFQGFILETVIPAVQDFWASIIDPAGEAQTQMKAIGDAIEVFASTFNIASGKVTSDQIFNWLGDGVVQAIKALTFLSVFAQETFEGLDLLLGGPNARYSSNAGQKLAGIQQLLGARNKATQAADQIKFAPDMQAGGGESARQGSISQGGRGRFDQFGNAISIQINTAATDGKQLLHEMNRALRDQGSDVIIR
jgi:hypothetical protein